MITLTFDWNCVIAFENKEKESEKLQGHAVAKLLEAHDRGMIDVAVTAVSAAEFPNVVLENDTFKKFTERLSKIGLHNKDVVMAPAVWDRSFIGQSFIQGPEEVSLYEKIRDIIAPSLRNPSKLTDRNRTNKFCDVGTLHAHIASGRDVFVTANLKDFQKKIDKLKELAPLVILSPAQAVERFLGCSH